MSQPNTIQKYLPIIATVLVVAGVVAMVRLGGKQQAGDQPSDSTENIAATSTKPIIVSLAGGSLRLMDNQSGQRECRLPDGFNGVDRADENGIAVRSATGGRMLLGFDCSIKDPKLVPGASNPSGSRAAVVAAKRRDGAGVVEISDGKYTEEITLRGKNSRPYRDPEIIGWLDDNAVAVTAFQGDARLALLVQTTGRITELLKLPDEAVEFKAGGNALWYVTVTPGEGIEFGPRAPSALHLVDANGRDTVVAEEKDSIIERLQAGPGATAAYAAGGALMLRNPNGKIRNAGTGTPLGWDGGYLLSLRDGRLLAVPLEGEPRELAAGITADAVAAWIIGDALDAAK